jgi:hypothetical protein
MIGEGSIGRDCDVTGRCLIKLLTRRIHGRTEHKTRKIQETGVRTQNRTQRLPNTSLDVTAVSSLLVSGVPTQNRTKRLPNTSLDVTAVSSLSVRKQTNFWYRNEELGRPRRRWEENAKKNVKRKVGNGCKADSSGSG